MDYPRAILAPLFDEEIPTEFSNPDEIIDESSSDQIRALPLLQREESFFDEIMDTAAALTQPMASQKIESSAANRATQLHKLDSQVFKIILKIINYPEKLTRFKKIAELISFRRATDNNSADSLGLQAQTFPIYSRDWTYPYLWCVLVEIFQIKDQKSCAK